MSENVIGNMMDMIKLDSDGLIVAVCQHYETGQVLMVGYMNKESLGITLKEKKACFFSKRDLFFSFPSLLYARLTSLPWISRGVE